MTESERRNKLTQWVTDRRAYCRDLVKIVTEEGALVPLELNDAQTLFFDILDDIERRGLPRRVVVLKARREGISTAVAGRFFHSVATRKHRYATIISHEPASTQVLFEMDKRIYDNLPAGFRPATKYNNRTDLIFNNTNGTGLDSAIRVSTAGKQDIGSGQLIHLLHCSELSKWPAHTTESILTSVMQTVPSHLDTEVIIESTAKGIGGKFHQMFKTCRYNYVCYIDPETRENKFRFEVNEDVPEGNIWCSIFLPWFVFRKYSMAIPAGFEMDEEEKEMAKTYNLVTQQVAYYRWLLHNKCGGSKLIRAQEYPCNPKEAFISSGDPVFDTDQLMRLIDATKPPVARYDILLSTRQFIAKPEGEFRVWKEPEPGKHYVIGADVAEGLEKGDFSCADVVDQLTGEQVAQWHGKTAPDIFAQILVSIAMRYNTAWIVPERNNHGNTVVLKIYDMGYQKMYVEKVPDPPNKPRKRYGWLTSRTTKPQIIDNLVAEMRDGTGGVACKETLEEMLGFKRDKDGSFGAEENEFDDRVMSYAIAKFVRTRLPLPNMVRAQNNPVGWQSPPPKREVPNIKAWL